MNRQLTFGIAAGLFILILCGIHWGDHVMPPQRRKLSGEPDVRGCDVLEIENTVSLLKNKMIIPPNYHQPYKLKDGKPNKDYSQYKEVPGLLKKYFPGKRNGFFIETGAYDGETFSNTLQVEKDLNWTGILIEPIHDNFEMLRAKNRKAFILEACLDNVCGVQERAFRGQRAGALIAKNISTATSFAKCVSLADVLSALNVEHVDWMVLDTEGNEPDIIRSFPFHSVTVDLIQIEVIVVGHYHGDNLRFLRRFLAALGYVEDKSTLSDVIFRRKSSNLPKYNERSRFKT